MPIKQNKFIIRNYHKKSVFSSFLPGISGLGGVPIWSFYVNRGQCMTSFGSRDKNHSIMEFYPAHQAYQRTEDMGFRTFIKSAGKVYEAFRQEDAEKIMQIGKNSLEITEINETEGLQVSIQYTTLSNEPLGGLIRKVQIKNLSGREKTVEVIDGMPEVIPYGITLEIMKEMGQTAKAWMEVLDHQVKAPKFKVRASMKDSAKVTAIEGFHYGVGFCNGEQLPVIISKETLFDYDTALKFPRNFVTAGVAGLEKEEQVTKNQLPCCFFMKGQVLAADEELTIYEIYGMSKTETIYNQVMERASRAGYFPQKESEAEQLTQELTEQIATRTGHSVFDEYCRQSYLDNILRGGYPISLSGHVFYVYSRKHGDIERDYNFFTVQPEAYSQGNGNFRDVNQNRRCDVQFMPFVGDKNIKYFYNCIQMNGYNPLGIEQSLFCLTDDQYRDVVPEVFTPGQLYGELNRMGLWDGEKEDLFHKIMKAAKEQSENSFLEGYWTDHWTYNLDLVESYLSIYPERERTLLFDDRTYTYRTAGAHILPRRQRYVLTQQGVRQYHFLKEAAAKTDIFTDQNG